ncbi:MAG TPA: GAF domain-containing protein, partial [Blastocatellia bacterium]
MPREPVQADVVDRFVACLNAGIAPLAAAADVTLEFVGSGLHEVVLRGRGCICDQSSIPLYRGGQPDAGCLPGRRTALITIPRNDLGGIRVCYQSGADSAVVTAIECLVKSAAERISLEDEERALLEELSSCWESLEAVYEIGSNVGANHAPLELLDRIVARAVSTSPSLAGVLWVTDEEQLQPIVCRNVTGLTVKPAAQGLVGRAMANVTSPTAINGCDQIQALPGPNPELSRACCAAVVPLVTRQGTLGALEVWSETDGCRLDSRVVRLLQTLAHQAGMVIENDRLHRAALDNMRLRHEMEIGSKIQQALLVAQPPTGLRGLRIAAVSVPSQSVD